VQERWLDRNRTKLRELFDVLELSDRWSDEPAELLAFMEAEWLGSEHGGQRDKVALPPEMADAARPMLAALGLAGRVPPPSDRYDEVIVLGAAAGGLHRRMALVREAGVVAEGLTVLAGLRPHERGARDGGIDELLAVDGRFSAAPGWVAAPELTDRARDLSTVSAGQFDAAAALFPSETALAELLLLKQWPLARRVGDVVGPAHPVENELGQRPWALRVWQQVGPIPWLRVLNGAPVDRSPRPPRPTSRSTLVEWFDLVVQKRPVKTVLAVVNQPHIGRVRLDLLEEMDALGRSDIDMDFAGCETLADVNVLLQLGEIPAWIRADERTTGLRT
jgi:hypothetical protein